jgi:hypothetical protein
MPSQTETTAMAIEMTRTARMIPAIFQPEKRFAAVTD